MEEQMLSEIEKKRSWILIEGFGRAALRGGVVVDPHLLDAGRRFNLPEAQQRLPRAARHKLQELALLLWSELSNDLPEPADDRLRLVVPAGVVHVRAKIVDVDCRAVARLAALPTIASDSGVSFA